MTEPMNKSNIPTNKQEIARELLAAEYERLGTKWSMDKARWLRDQTDNGMYIPVALATRAITRALTPSPSGDGS